MRPDNRCETDYRKWGAANFRGLIVGKSTRANMLRQLGKPKWSQTKPEDKEEKERAREREQARRVTWNNYDSIGELPSITDIATDTRTGIITRIDFYPERLTRDEAIAHFGPNCILTKYEFDRCERPKTSSHFMNPPQVLC